MNGFISVLLLNYRVDTQPTKLTNFLIQPERAIQIFLHGIDVSTSILR